MSDISLQNISNWFNIFIKFVCDFKIKKKKLLLMIIKIFNKLLYLNIYIKNMHKYKFIWNIIKYIKIIIYQFY